MKRQNGSILWAVPAGAVLLSGMFVGGYLFGELRRSNGHLDVSMSLQRLPSQVKNTIAPAKAQNLDPLQTWTVVDRIKRDYYDKSKVNETEIGYSAIRGLLASLGDQFTRFMDPKEYSEMQEDTRGDFVGIGASLDVDPLGAVIKRPIKDSPAYKKGLLANDVIIKVDGVTVAGMDIDDIVRRIRGERFTNVTLTIKRKDHDEPLVFTIKRDIINSPNMEAFMEDKENKIGRVWLGQFNEKAPEQIAEGVSKLEKQGMKGLILDLRFNPGGLLSSAQQIASFFENKGHVVITQDKDGNQINIDRDPSLYHSTDYPIIVLVNGNSASASEIVTGCLKDWNAATVVGEKTFGKGLVQSVIPLPGNTAVAITTNIYLTPNGTDINRKRLPTGKFEGGGVQPDIEVKANETWTFLNIENDKDDVQLQRSLEIMRQKIADAKNNKSKNDIARDH